MNGIRRGLAAIMAMLPMVFAGCLHVDLDNLPGLGGGNPCCGGNPAILLPLLAEKLLATVNGVALTMAPGGDAAAQLHFTAENRWRVTCANAQAGPSAITIQLPPEVHAGYVYTEDTLCCMDLLTCQVTAGDAMSIYRVHPDHPFTMTVSEWGGPGGRVKAIFAGTLFNPSTGCTMTVTGGLLDVIIH